MYNNIIMYVYVILGWGLWVGIICVLWRWMRVRVYTFSKAASSPRPDPNLISAQPQP